MRDPVFDGGNRLLLALSADERAALPLEQVSLCHGQMLYRHGDRIEHVWFPETGIISQRLQLREGGAAEVGTIGSEGLVGLAAFLGDGVAHSDALVQVPGCALRMPVAHLRAAADAPGRFRRVLRRYVQAFMAQIAQSAVCNRLHSAEQRACRWLLMAHDRAAQDTVPLTHEFLGEMLGANRTTVTLTLAALRRAGLISEGRGTVTILDRGRLEAAACECYAIVRDEYQRLFSPASLDHD